MKQTNETHPLGFYIFESRVSANSNYIENLEEASKLLTYINYYLKDFLVVHDYLISRHGIQLAVKLRSSDEITKAYKVKRKSDKKKNLDIWKIISERIRLCLSTYVRVINFDRNRTGVLVHSSYRKYYFETKEEAMTHLDKMRKQQVKIYQRKKKYRGSKTHYKIDHSVGKGSIFLCSKELRNERRKNSNYQQKSDLTDLVLQKWVNLTSSLHNAFMKQKTNTQNSKHEP